jgi:hypothetical protein
MTTSRNVAGANVADPTLPRPLAMTAGDSPEGEVQSTGGVPVGGASGAGSGMCGLRSERA